MSRFWQVVHNVVAHPFLATGTESSEKFHDWTGRKGWPDEVDEEFESFVRAHCNFIKSYARTFEAKGLKEQFLALIDKSNKEIFAAYWDFVDEKALERSGTEKVYGDGEPKTISVNGTYLDTEERALDYDDLTQLAYPDAEGEIPLMTITYRGDNGSRGMLSPGEVVVLSDGMVFTVVHTGGA